MSIPTYIQGYPQDGSSLGNSKAQIRANLDGTFLNMSVEHFNQNSGTPGLHIKSTYPAGSRPSTTSGQIALYSKAVTGGTALFAVRDNKTSSEVQLTTPLGTAPVVAQPGYSFLPGGILIQWGIALVIYGKVPLNTFVTFPTPFPTGVFNIQTTPITAVSTTTSLATIGIVSLKTSGGNKVGFNYNAVTDSDGKYENFYWLAIGN
jgi:hypothetical protein